MAGHWERISAGNSVSISADGSNCMSASNVCFVCFVFFVCSVWFVLFVLFVLFCLCCVFCFVCFVCVVLSALVCLFVYGDFVTLLHTPMLGL